MSKKAVHVPKNIMGRKLEGEWVFLNLENGVYYGLNEIGSRIWDEFVKGWAFSEIIERLQEVFLVGRGTLEKDARNFLKQLAKEGFIEREALPA